MDLGLENIVIAFFFVLPGFLSGAVRRAIEPGPEESVVDWVVTSVLASLTFNAVMLGLVILLGGTLFAQSIKEVITGIDSYTVRQAAYYLGGLYALAIGWGIASALLWRWRPRKLAFLWRLTPILPDEDVLTPTLTDLYKDAKNRSVVWVRVHREHETILGKLELTSVKIEQEKPIELYLNPAFITPNNATAPIAPMAGATAGGLYMRLNPGDLTELMTAPTDWK